MCLDPPLRIDELPEEETWFCRKCKAERVRKTQRTATNPQSKDKKDDAPGRGKQEKPIAQVFRALVSKMESDNPVQFRLPQEIRQFFVGVGTGQRGEYVDEKGARMKYE
jgi:hypothetical protein